MRHGERRAVLKQEAACALPNIYAIEDDKHETDLSISYRIGVRDSFSKLSMKDTVKFLTEAVQSRHHVITANPIMVMTAVNQPEYKQMMQSAEIIVPDGTRDRLGRQCGRRTAGGARYRLLHGVLKVGNL